MSFLTLISTPFLPTTLLVNRTVLSLVNVSTLAVFCIFLIYADKNLTSSSYSIPLH